MLQSRTLKEAKTIRLLMPLLRAYGWALPVTVLLGTASSFAESLGLSLFVPLLASLEGGANLSQAPAGLQAFFHLVLARMPAGNPLPYIVGLILILTFAKAALTFSHSVLASHISSRATHSVRTRIFSKLMDVSQQTLDRTSSGRLVNLLATDTWHTSDAISLFIGLVVNLCSIAVFSLLLLAISWKLTILVAAGVAAVSAAVQIVTAGARRLGQEGVKANAVLSEHMLDALEGLREIQMFGLRSYRQKLFDAVSQTVRSIYFRLDLLHRAAAPLSEILYVALLLGLLLIGVASHGSIAGMIVFLLVLYRLQPQIRQLDSARLSLVALTTPVEEVMRFLAAEPKGMASRAPVRALRNAIEFDDVSFSYGDEFEFRLDNLSFTVPAGSTTAIVGRSGSGKSTLIRLLCRFYDPASGTIYVDGQPLSEFDTGRWREQIAWVSQDAHLFRASVYENIRYGRIEATPGEVIAAAVLAGVDTFVAQLPEGYDTKIGNGGIGSGGADLSNGQVQRIALARAFVRKASILILDEATNALDSLSEESIQERLRQVAGQHTVIVISHRLSTVKNADHVVVLEEGRISEQGTPAQLSSRRGFFAQMRELQHVDF